MPSIYTGSAGHGGPLTDNSNRFKVSITDKIFYKGANIMPFTQMSRKAQKKAIGNWKFTVLEDEPMSRLDAINNGGGYNSSATEFVVDNGNLFRPQTMGKITRTGEPFLVRAVSGNTLTVVRGYGTTAAATILDDDEILISGLAMSERSSAPEVRQTVVSSRDNYLQFFSRVTDLTEIRDNIDDYGESESSRQHKATRLDIRKDIELSFLFGEPLFDEEGQSPIDGTVVYARGTTGGLKYWIDNSASSNVLDAGGLITERNLWDWLGPMIENSEEDMGDGEVEMALMCSSTAYKSIHEWVRGDMHFEANGKILKEYGLKLDKIQTPVGRVNLMRHYLLKGEEYGDYIFAVNMKNIGYRYLKNMDIKVKVDIQDNDAHYIADEVYGVAGLFLTIPGTHGYAKNCGLGG